MVSIQFCICVLGGVGISLWQMVLRSGMKNLWGREQHLFYNYSRCALLTLCYYSPPYPLQKHVLVIGECCFWCGSSRHFPDHEPTTTNASKLQVLASMLKVEGRVYYLRWICMSPYYKYEVKPRYDGLDWHMMHSQDLRSPEARNRLRRGSRE